MSTILVNLAGVALMGVIVWWFWLSQSSDSQPESRTGPDTGKPNHH